MIKAICSDIDGTLLNSDRELSQRTIQAIREIKDDIPVILASSRMPAAMRHLQKQLGIEDQPLICYNGGYVLRQTSNGKTAIYDSQIIAYDISMAIAQVVSETSLHASFYMEDSWHAPQMDQWTEREESNTKVKATIKSNNQLLNEWQPDQIGAHKIMVMGDQAEMDHIVQSLNDLHGNDLHLYRSKSTYLEIAPKQISKATALKLVLQKDYDFTMEQVMAFGDNYNDIDLLQSVGKGVAVENARAELKAVASEVTASGKQDGVAIAIEKHFNL